MLTPIDTGPQKDDKTI